MTDTSSAATSLDDLLAAILRGDPVEPRALTERGADAIYAHFGGWQG